MGAAFMLLLLAAITAGCLQLAYKGLALGTIPLSGTTDLTGRSARVMGVVCLLLGVLFGSWSLFGILSLAMR